jgi:hypothetical protein
MVLHSFPDQLKCQNVPAFKLNRKDWPGQAAEDAASVYGCTMRKQSGNDCPDPHVRAQYPCDAIDNTETAGRVLLIAFINHNLLIAFDFSWHLIFLIPRRHSQDIPSCKLLWCIDEPGTIG